MSKWEMSKLEDICELITDGTHQTPKYVDEGYIFLSSKNVTTKSIDWENVKYISEELHDKLYKRLKPQKGDILLAKNGTTGVAALVDRDEVFDIYVSLALLRPKQEIYAPYLLNVINSPYTKRQFNKSLKGIGVPNLHLSEIRKVMVPIPPINIQKQIANILDNTQEIIDIQKKQLEELDHLIKATFYAYFSKFINDDNIYRSIKDCISFIDYRGKTPVKTNVGVPLITAKNVGFGYFRENPQEYITEELYETIMTRGFPRANNILFTTEGATLGNVSRIPLNYDRFAVGQRLITMIPNEDLTPEYLERYMTTPYFQYSVMKKATGSSAQGIRSAELKTIKIPVPPLELQNKFSEIVTNIEQQKFIVKKSVEQSQTLFNGLMSKYFDE